jgi:quinol-cytochrome oxidoreductase complex cytochrome b subunit
MLLLHVLVLLLHLLVVGLLLLLLLQLRLLLLLHVEVGELLGCRKKRQHRQRAVANPIIRRCM